MRQAKRTSINMIIPPWGRAGGREVGSNDCTDLELVVGVVVHIQQDHNIGRLKVEAVGAGLRGQELEGRARRHTRCQSIILILIILSLL
jgi:hypothetical protein